MGDRGDCAPNAPGLATPEDPAAAQHPVFNASGIEAFVNGYILEQALIVDVQGILDCIETRLEYQRRIGKLEGAPDKVQLVACLEQAVTDQTAEDFRQLQRGERSAVEGNERDQFLVTGLGVRPHHARSVAVAYNALALKTRRAFFALAINIIPMEELIGAEWKTAEELREDVNLALDALMGVEAPKP